MKISFSWLKNYINTSLNINIIAEILTSIGLEVESIIKYNNDDILLINITPNRSDAISHYGVARDLYAALKIRNYNNYNLIKQQIFNNINLQNNLYQYNVIINDDQCIRYTSVIISNIEVMESPNWLKEKIISIGIDPVNNIIDISNFIMHDIGQPINIFDIKEDIKNINIIIEKKSKLLNNIHTNQKLNDEDLLVIYNNNLLSIASILQEKKYNIICNTKNILIESACYNTEIIRKIAKRYHINNDLSFRFERGVDPNMTLYALYKTIYLIKKIANGHQYSQIIDIYKNPKKGFIVYLTFRKLYSIIGNFIKTSIVINILLVLDIKIINHNKKYLKLLIPYYRIDVQREIDVIEEILRIYGYDNIKLNNNLNLNIKFYNDKFIKNEIIQNLEINISNQLVSHGFYEIINLSIKKKYNIKNYLSNNKNINIINPLNNEMKELRSNLLEGMLESISYNLKRKNFNIKFFEWGKIHYYNNINFVEKMYLSIIISIKNNTKYINNNIFYIKNIVQQILQLSGIDNYTQLNENMPMMDNCLILKYKNINIVYLGKIKEKILNKMDIYHENVYFANLDWDLIKNFIFDKNIIYKPISKYPIVKRDLSMLIDSTISYEEIVKLSLKLEPKLLKDITLFDVYENKTLPINKKSYGLSFYFEDKNQTLTDIVIDKTMEYLKQELQKKLGIIFR